MRRSAALASANMVWWIRLSNIARIKMEIVVSDFMRPVLRRASLHQLQNLEFLSASRLISRRYASAKFVR